MDLILSSIPQFFLNNTVMLSDRIHTIYLSPVLPHHPTQANLPTQSAEPHLILECETHFLSVKSLLHLIFLSISESQLKLQSKPVEVKVKLKR